MGGVKGGLKSWRGGELSEGSRGEREREREWEAGDKRLEVGTEEWRVDGWEWTVDSGGWKMDGGMRDTAWNSEWRANVECK